MSDVARLRIWDDPAIRDNMRVLRQSNHIESSAQENPRHKDGHAHKDQDGQK
jgi:hypothetical protein